MSWRIPDEAPWEAPASKPPAGPPLLASTRASALLPPGNYWCNVVRYADGSAVLGVYGPYCSQEEANKESRRLQDAGIYVHDAWEATPLRAIDLGAQEGDHPPKDGPEGDHPTPQSPQEGQEGDHP